MKMKTWKKISEGDTACIIAPSYGIALGDNVEEAIQKAEKIVREYKLKPYTYPNMIVPGNHSLFDNNDFMFANSDEVRGDQLIDALNNPECDIVWCYRGGYGAIRLLNKLAETKEPSEVKPFIGFSDITILHTFMNNIWNWPTIHFGMPGALTKVMEREDTKQSLQDIIFGKISEVTFKLINISTQEYNNEKILGITCGGNMYNFEKMLGTEYQISLVEKILIIEDIGEPGRKIDGFLQKIQLTPNFNQIKAIILGTFLPTKDQLIFDKLFKDFTSNIKIPVFKLSNEDTIGHGDINKALPLNTLAAIIFNNDSNQYEMLVETGITRQAHDEL